MLICFCLSHLEIAGDMWSEAGVSLLGINQYYVGEDWVLEERLLSAEPFQGSHTGEAIDEKTLEAMKAAGTQGEDLHSEIFHCVSDNGANIVKGWKGFDGGFCAAHTPELAVNNFLGDEAVKPTVKKIKGVCNCKCRDIYWIVCSAK
jgi:hypothetical protein